MNPTNPDDYNGQDDPFRPDASEHSEHSEDSGQSDSEPQQPAPQDQAGSDGSGWSAPSDQEAREQANEDTLVQGYDQQDPQAYGDPYQQGREAAAGPGYDPSQHAPQGYGAPGPGAPGPGAPGPGAPGFGAPGYGQQPPPQGPYGYGYPGYGGAYPPPGPTPPRPSHASGPLMTPGDGGFGHGPSAPPPYMPPPRRPKRSKRVPALVLAAVVAGGLAGVGSAAAYDAMNDPETTPVVDSLQGSPTSSQSDAAAEPGSVEGVANAVLPSVVKIDVSGGSGAGSGSGIIIQSNGTILTNNHVVELAEGGGQIAVSFNDGSTARAEIVGTDPLTDLAVIKAEGVSGLKPAHLGSSSQVDVGEPVVAVGSPFGLESTVTSGIVSAVDRPVTAGDVPGAQSTVFPAIQTDAAINPGNSGGALVNTQGEVIGINSAIRSTTSLSGEAGSIGLGFAIPVDEAAPIAQQLVNGDTATHARLGVTVGTPQDENGLPGGAVVRQVSGGTAAAQAGLQNGDVITKVDSNVISTSDSLVAIVRTYRPGDEVQLTVLRDGAQRKVTLKLGSDAGSSAS